MAILELIDICDEGIQVEASDHRSENADSHQFLQDDSNQNVMNTTTNLLEKQILDVAEVENCAESLIYLDATLAIQKVVNLHEKLKKSYSENDLIEINASQVASIDTATLQLLIALKKEAVKQQKQIVFSAPSHRFIESAELLGLLDILEIDPV
ncbi:MAG: STAS domain-containing protein [Methylosarcina sp.]